MESRQVTLLTKGYLSGRLNFEYTNPLSHLRESFILSVIEKEHIAEILKLRLQGQAGYITVNPREGGKAVQAVLDDYIQLSLPYAGKPSKIDHYASGKESPKTPDEWKQILKTLKDKKSK